TCRTAVQRDVRGRPMSEYRAASAHDHRSHVARRNHRDMKMNRGSARETGHARPTAPAARLPAPAETGCVNPTAVVERHPSPGISGGEHEAESRIPRPGSIHKRIPAD